MWQRLNPSNPMSYLGVAVDRFLKWYGHVIWYCALTHQGTFVITERISDTKCVTARNDLFHFPLAFLPPKTLKFYNKLREVSFSNCHKFANICSFSFILHACLVFLKYALYYWKSEILQRRKHKKNIWLFSIFSSPLTHCNLLNSWLGILIQWIDW